MASPTVVWYMSKLNDPPNSMTLTFRESYAPLSDRKISFDLSDGKLAAVIVPDFVYVADVIDDVGNLRIRKVWPREAIQEIALDGYSEKIPQAPPEMPTMSELGEAPAEPMPNQTVN